MKCQACGGEMKVAKVKSYEYRECGLSNIVLCGIERHTCQKCREEYLAIPKINQLHRLIGMNLCCKNERLSGAEIRYLRKEMELSSKGFAKLLSITPEALSRIENEAKAPSSMLEKFIRSVFMNVVSNEPRYSLHLNIAALFQEAGKLPQTGAKMQLRPEQWIDKLTVPSCLNLCTAH